jgi:hypothetical protein
LPTAETRAVRTYYTQLRLDPLGKESAEEMLTALLGDGNDLLPLKRLIIERTESNPFFIVGQVTTDLRCCVIASLLVSRNAATRNCIFRRFAGARLLPAISWPASTLCENRQPARR